MPNSQIARDVFEQTDMILPDERKNAVHNKKAIAFKLEENG